MAGIKISKYWIIGGWKNLIINGWVRQNAPIMPYPPLKIGGGNPFQSNFGATKDT